MRCTEALVAVVLCLAPLTLAGAEADPTLEVISPTQTIAVGDPMSVRVQARGGAGGLFGTPEVSAEPGGPWEVLQGPRPVGDARPPAWELVLAPMAVGDLELPSMVVSYRSPEGSTSEARTETALTVTVASVLAPDDAGEPAPLLDPIGVRGLPWEWLPPVLALASPLLAAGVLWLRRRRMEGQGPSPMPSPIEELRRVATEIEERIGRQPAEEVCDGLATAARRYLERRTGEPALEMTSFEIRRRGRSLGWPEDGRRHLQRVLETADGIRFGRRSGDEGELRAAVDALRGAALRIEEHLRPHSDDDGVTREAVS